jgi:type IV fimbrial biogenesis protein FimT
MKAIQRSRAAGLTLIELMVVLAVATILAILAAPSFTDFIVLQRLKSVNAQLVTDLQYARAEAASRGLLVHVRVRWQAAGDTCYIVFTSEGSTAPSTDCDCLAAPGSRCPLASTRELKSVVLARSRAVTVNVPAGQAFFMAFDPVNGALVVPPSDSAAANPQPFGFDVAVDTARSLRTAVALSGRPSVCAPAGSTVGGPPC